MARYPYPYPFQSDEEPRGPRIGWVIAALLVLFISILIFMAPRGLQIPAGLLPPAAGDYTANPELAAFHRFPATIHTQSYLGQNPELAAFHRFPATIRMQAYLRQNPELAAFRRFEREHAPQVPVLQQYSSPLDQFYFSVNRGTDEVYSAFLSRNPEIALFNSFVAERR
jgi:hypothetical protein